jgi:hypothetical protein
MIIMVIIIVVIIVFYDCNSANDSNTCNSALFVRDWVSSFFMYSIFSLIIRVTGLKS